MTFIKFLFKISPALAITTSKIVFIFTNIDLYIAIVNILLNNNIYTQKIIGHCFNAIIQSFKSFIYGTCTIYCVSMLFTPILYVLCKDFIDNYIK